MPPPRQLEQLLQDLEDGALSAEDHELLMNLLREQPEAREAYHKHMALAIGLHELAEARAPEFGKFTRMTPEAIQSRSLRRALFATAAVIALLAVLGSLIVIRAKPLPPASVTAGAGAVWHFADGGIGENGDFLPASRISVEHGAVELTTRHSTRMLLEGPALFEIHDSRSVSLSKGKGWFDVAPKDKGLFTVQTGRQKVIDLGTQFGVLALGDSDRVQVESGHVRLESNFPGISSIDLKTGQAADVDLAGRATLTDYDPALFLNALPVGLIAIHWSFDEEKSNGFPAKANGFDPAPMKVSDLSGKTIPARTIPGRFGMALDFTAGDSFGKSDFYGISGSGPRTVAMWIKGKKIERRGYTPSLLDWGDEAIPGGSWSVRIQCATGILGTQWENTGWITAGKLNSRDIFDEDWHHIAFVFTGHLDESGKFELRHYIDGERVENVRGRMGHAVNTRGGNAESLLRLACDRRSPHGTKNIPVAVDELYIVRAALSDGQIGTLFRENRLVVEE